MVPAAALKAAIRVVVAALALATQNAAVVATWVVLHVVKAACKPRRFLLELKSLSLVQRTRLNDFILSNNSKQSLTVA
jgi:hypothetical protein